MKKNNLKVMIAALAAVMVVGIAGLGIAKTSAGFKFTAKSEDATIEAADFTAKVTVDGNEMVLDHNTSGSQAWNIGEVGASAPIFFDGTDATIVKKIVIENTGAVAQSINLAAVVNAADASKTNDVAMAERMVTEMRAVIDVGMPQVVPGFTGTANLAAGEKIEVTLTVTPTSADLNTPGADNEAINGTANISLSLDITPVR